MNPPQEDLQPPLNPLRSEDLVQTLGSHFVSLSFRQKGLRQNGNVTLNHRGSISGFILSRSDKWFLVTAGHCLDSFDLAEKDGDTFDQWQINGTYGNEAMDHLLVPFHIEEGQRHKIFEPDMRIDHGFIPLSEFYVKQLKANGVKALSESYYDAERPSPEIREDFINYVLLGIPDEYFKIERSIMKGAFVAITLGELDGHQDKPHIFIGKLYDFVNTREEDEIPDMKSIVGMSGGPIFCCWYDENLNFSYKIVAIQSKWFKDELVIWGCRISELLPKIDAYLETI